MADLRFDDRVAVVTGGGRGLGRSYALLLAAQGAKVVVNDPGGSIAGDGTDAGPAEEVVREITATGGEAVASTESVATPEGGKAIIDTALDRYGRIDILVHNAGNVRPASLKEMSYDDFEAVVDVHLRGAFHVVRPAFPLMCEAGYGRIVLTSSIGGLYGNHEVANYAVAKAGVIGLSNVAAIEGRRARRQEQRHRARCGDENGRGHRHLRLSADGPGVGCTRGRLAGARILFRHWRDACRARRAGGEGSRLRNSRRIPAVMVHRGGRRPHRRNPRRVGSRRLSRSCPTATATTSATASRWLPNAGARRHSMPSGPLSGVLVVDLTAMVMGPYCTQIMADMGADVIKIEPPEGDNTRYISVGPAPGMSGVFVNVNRGKRSVVLDLRSEAGRTALRRLVLEADVFIHSMRAKAITKLELRL